MKRHLCQFGTQATGHAYFTIVHDSERLAGWSTPEVNARTFVIPGSNPPRSETQIVSIGPSTVSWRLWFVSLEDYWKMLAKLGTVGTLTVPAKIQTHPGIYQDVAGSEVIHLASTLLLGLDTDSPDPDGQIEAVATFQRHIDPATGLVAS